MRSYSDYIDCHNCDDTGREFFYVDDYQLNSYYCWCDSGLEEMLKDNLIRKGITLGPVRNRDHYEYIWRTFTERGRKLPYRGEVWRAR